MKENGLSGYFKNILLLALALLALPGAIFSAAKITFDSEVHLFKEVESGAMVRLTTEKRRKDEG